jgi:hypothetical protein
MVYRVINATTSSKSAITTTNITAVETAEAQINIGYSWAGSNFN